MKTVLSYALLLATWIVIVTIIVYLWVSKALEPPFWSFIILLAIAVVPLASRLRIGNWLDFTKDMRQLKQDVEGNKESIKQFGVQLANISTNLQNVITTRQVQQQVFTNLNLTNPETAKAFAQSFTASPESLYPPPAAERANKEDKNVVYFLWAADRVISSAELPLLALYTAVIGWLEGNESVIEDKRTHQPLKRLIQELRQIYEKQGQQEQFPTIKEGMPQHLDALENLIDLRDSVAHGKLKPPATKEGQNIIFKATRAAYYIGGIVTAISLAWGLDRVPRKSAS